MTLPLASKRRRARDADSAASSNRPAAPCASARNTSAFALPLDVVGRLHLSHARRGKLDALVICTVAREELPSDAAPQRLRDPIGGRRDLLAERGETSGLVESALPVQGLGQQACDRGDVVPLADGIQGLVVLAELGLSRDGVPGEQFHPPGVERHRGGVEPETELLQDGSPATVVIARSFEVPVHGPEVGQRAERHALRAAIALCDPQ